MRSKRQLELRSSLDARTEWDAAEVDAAAFVDCDEGDDETSVEGSGCDEQPVKACSPSAYYRRVDRRETRRSRRRWFVI